jgi:hypothetical protein
LLTRYRRESGADSLRSRTSPFSAAIVSFMNNGIPRDLCIKKSAGYGLDSQAAKAARQYRFDPATFEGKPCPRALPSRLNSRSTDGLPCPVRSAQNYAALQHNRVVRISKTSPAAPSCAFQAGFSS